MRGPRSILFWTCVLAITGCAVSSHYVPPDQTPPPRAPSGGSPDEPSVQPPASPKDWAGHYTGIADFFSGAEGIWQRGLKANVSIQAVEGHTLEIMGVANSRSRSTFKVSRVDAGTRNEIEGTQVSGEIGGINYSKVEYSFSKEGEKLNGEVTEYHSINSGPLTRGGVWIFEVRKRVSYQFAEPQLNPPRPRIGAD